VLGHTKCGAVKGACDDVKLGKLTGLLSKLKPAVEAAHRVSHNGSPANQDFVEEVALLNVFETVNQIPKRSEILADLIRDGSIILVAAMYNVETGVVEFHDDISTTGSQVEGSQKNASR
ncbi:MAG TPA: carbonic anhydrase, partial [Chryseolinea sp.]